MVDRELVREWIENVRDRKYTETRGVLPVKAKHGVVDGCWFRFCQYAARNTDMSYAEVRREWDRGDFVDGDDMLEELKELSYWCKDGRMLTNVRVAEEQGGIRDLVRDYGIDTVAEASYNGVHYIRDAEDIEAEGGEQVNSTTWD